MNKLRRKRISKLAERLQELLNSGTEIDIAIFEDLIDEIQTILNEEEDYFYNIPENLQSGSRYEESEEAIDMLGDAVSDLEYIDDEYSQEEIRNCVSSAIDNLNNCV